MEDSVKRLSTVTVIVMVLALCASLHAQPVSMMKQKVADLNITFEIPNTWKQIKQPGNNGDLMFVSPDTVIHLVLRPLKVEGDDPAVVLDKIVKEKKLKPTGKLVKKEIGKLKRATIRVRGLVKKEDSVGSISIIFYRDVFYLAFMHAPIKQLPELPEYVRDFEDSFHQI
jgi:hypothetical protein